LTGRELAGGEVTGGKTTTLGFLSLTLKAQVWFW
jgi:hypothetical protein